jgi:oligoribonuclease (3'-5' exoribonuclease)
MEVRVMFEMSHLPVELTDAELDVVAGGSDLVIDQNDAVIAVIAVGVVVQDVNVNVGTGPVINA